MVSYHFSLCLPHFSFTTSPPLLRLHAPPPLHFRNGTPPLRTAVCVESTSEALPSLPPAQQYTGNSQPFYQPPLVVIIFDQVWGLRKSGGLVSLYTASSLPHCRCCAAPLHSVGAFVLACRVASRKSNEKKRTPLHHTNNKLALLSKRRTGVSHPQCHN